VNDQLDQGRLRWRTNDETPPAGQYISSPYDHDARSSQRRGLTWIGYKVHLTERCDADLPHLIHQRGNHDGHHL
jgi:transposase